MGEGGSEDQAEEKSEDGKFHDQNLFHSGSGGFDCDGATDWHKGGSGIEIKDDGFVRGFTIGNVIVPAVHADVVTRTVQIVEAWIGWAGIDSWRICFKSTIGI